MKVVFTFLADVVNGFLHIPGNIAYWTSELTTKIFEWSTYVIQTPLFIFNNSAVQETAKTFGGISILIVTILTMIEGAKQILQKKTTSPGKIVNRYIVALIGAGFAPMLFEQSFKLINTLVTSISKIGAKTAAPKLAINHALTAADWLNALGLVVFDLLLIALLIPVALQNFRRIFDLMVLFCITPLALTAWIFDDHRHMFSKWWYNLKKLSLTPLIYAVFISMMGILIFSTKNVTGAALFIKLGIMIGGLNRMANIPNFVKAKLDDGPTIDSSFGNMLGRIKNLRRSFDPKSYATLVWGKKKAGETNKSFNNWHDKKFNNSMKPKNK
jgi:hypothetical protein